MRSLESRIEKAKTTDVALLARIERAAAVAFIGWDVPDSVFTDATPLDVLVTAQRAGLLWVAADAGGLIGFAVARAVGEQLVLQEIDVLPEHAGRGVGSMLIEAVVREARDRRCSHTYLSTYRDVPWNGPWYVRRGFEPADDCDPVGQALLAVDAEHGLCTMPRVALRRVTGV